MAAHRLWRLLACVHLLRAPEVLECVSCERSSVCAPRRIWTCRHFARTCRTPGSGLFRLLPDEPSLCFGPSGEAQEIETESRWLQETRRSISESRRALAKCSVFEIKYFNYTLFAPMVDLSHDHARSMGRINRRVRELATMRSSVFRQDEDWSAECVEAGQIRFHACVRSRIPSELMDVWSALF